MSKKQIIYVDNKPHIKCNVVILPHNNIDTILTMYLDVNKKPIELSKNNSKLQYHTNQYLYFTSNEEIKEGDLFYNTFDDKIQKCTKHQLHDGEFAKLRVYVEGGDYNESICKKIIATTDTLITVHRFNNDSDKLPQPSQQFIEKYIEEYNKGNIITEVLVEITSNECYNPRTPWIKIPCIPYVKLDSQNQITIRKQKDSWSREEVVGLLNKLGYDLAGNGMLLDANLKVRKEWIEENL